MKKPMYSLMITILISMSFTACYDKSADYPEMENAPEAPSETMIQLYQVNDEKLIPSQAGYAEQQWMENQAKHTEMWNFYKSLSTDESLDWVTEFEIYDGGGDELGYVINLDSDLSSWRLGLAIDAVSQDGNLDFDREFTHTVIHEQFHLISLNSTQINPLSESCDYQNQEGCASDGSYLDDFVEIFWEDLLSEHEKISHNDNKVFRFYKKYKDQFVNDYAATNPEEDIAESFTYFVKTEEGGLGNKIRDEKINHFYQYPELVELRNKIRESGIELGEAVMGQKAHNHKRCKHKKVL